MTTMASELKSEKNIFKLKTNLLITMVMLAVFYPVFELIRVIIVNGIMSPFYPGYQWQFIGEIVFIVLAYLSIPVWCHLIIKYGFKASKQIKYKESNNPPTF